MQNLKAGAGAFDDDVAHYRWDGGVLAGFVDPIAASGVRAKYFEDNHDARGKTLSVREAGAGDKAIGVADGLADRSCRPTQVRKLSNVHGFGGATFMQKA
jgi:hypothetical protein